MQFDSQQRCEKRPAMPRLSAAWMLAVGAVLLLPACSGATSKGGGSESAAASAPASASTAQPPFLSQLAQKGRLTVQKSFSTEIPGLKGYVVKMENGQYQVVYGEDGHLFAGRIFDAKGQELTSRYSKEYLPKPDVKGAVEAIDKVGHVIEEGSKTAPAIYVFADPNCSFCHKFYDEVEPLVKAGKLRVRWVLVGFLKKSSPDKAAAILTASDPVDALHANEDQFDEAKEEGGIKPDAKPSAQMLQVIKAHYAAMSQAGGSGTPTILYHKADGSWTVKVGAPPAAWLEKNVIAPAKGK
jgi:Protein-disulfide isomerase